jgi:hypothetical protein
MVLNTCQVLTTVNMKSAVLWDVTSCSLVQMYKMLKFSLERAMKAQRGSRGIALLFL